MVKIFLRSSYAVLILLIFGCNKNCLFLTVRKEADSLKISKRIIEGQLDNGLTYFYLRNANPKGRCMLRFNVATGSFNETPTELGMAHMVEHLAFDNRVISKSESLLVHGSTVFESREPRIVSSGYNIVHNGRHCRVVCTLMKNTRRGRCFRKLGLVLATLTV